MVNLRLLALAALLVIFAVIIGLIYRAGGDAALSSITKQDLEAGNASDDDRTRFDHCAFGMWDFGAGKCRGPAPGGGD
jgi:hypothetical protein